MRKWRFNPDYVRDERDRHLRPATQKEQQTILLYEILEELKKLTARNAPSGSGLEVLPPPIQIDSSAIVDDFSYYRPPVH